MNSIPENSYTNNIKNFVNNKIVKYGFSISVIVTTLVGDSNKLVILEEKCKTFTVEKTIKLTAYYSPLKGQKYYSRKYKNGKFTGKRRSYTQEIKMQGEGHTTSSGKAVEIGMLAGPKIYDFGTKINIPGLNKYDLPENYIVEDRGGKIKGNKFDIYVGKGLPALKKAEKMGIFSTKGIISVINCKDIDKKNKI